jgi:hypothetical protein
LPSPRKRTHRPGWEGGDEVGDNREKAKKAHLLKSTPCKKLPMLEVTTVDKPKVTWGIYGVYNTVKSIPQRLALKVLDCRAVFIRAQR